MKNIFKNVNIRNFNDEYDVIIVPKNDMLDVLNLLDQLTKVDYISNYDAEMETAGFISKLYYVSEVADQIKENEEIDSLKNMTNENLYNIAESLESDCIGYDLTNNITSNAMKVAINKEIVSQYLKGEEQ